MPVSPARAAAFDVLLAVEQKQAFAAELLHSSKNEQLSSADHGLATAIAMGVLRWRSRLDDLVAPLATKPLAKFDVEVLTALRMGAFQLAALERVPARAAINESVELTKRAGKRSAAGMVNAILRKLAEQGPKLTAAAKENSAVELAKAVAHPLWLVERWNAEFGMDAARAICEWDQNPPESALRLADESVAAELESEGIKLAPGALLQSARRVVSGDVTRTRAFREGRAYIQDEGSHLVALLVGQGKRILDCCAAPGSKTGAIAQRNVDSEIIAAEIHPHRARLMQKLLRAPNVQVVTGDVTKMELPGSFDRVLADVPCSGTGTLARNPEIKWSLRREDLADLQQRQIAILRAALGKLAPGGRLVYSTCSLEREENEAVVEAIGDGFVVRDCAEELKGLVERPEWLCRGKFLRTLPGVHPCDGFFAAVVERV